MKPCSVILDAVALKYEFDLKDKVTFIMGLSGTGKSLLVETVNGIRLGITTYSSSNNGNIIDATYLNYNEFMKIYNDYSNTIFFIDEVTLIDINLIIDFIDSTDNMFVIISRDKSNIFKRIRSFSSISELYTLGTHDNVTTNSLRSIYKIGDSFKFNSNHVGIVTEDSGNLYKMIKSLGYNVKTSSGNSRIGKQVNILSKDGIDNVLVIADMSNIGVNFTITEFISSHTSSKVKYIYVHSSEQLLLPMISDKYIDVAENPYNLIDLNIYSSYESFYTKYMNSEFNKIFGRDYEKNIPNEKEYFRNTDILNDFIKSYTDQELGLFEVFSNNVNYNRFDHFVLYRDYSNMSSITKGDMNDVCEKYSVELNLYEWSDLCSIGKDIFQIAYREDGTFMVHSDNVLYVKSNDLEISFNCDSKMINALLLLYCKDYSKLIKILN